MRILPQGIGKTRNANIKAEPQRRAIHAALALALALGGTFRQLALLSTVARLATYLVTCLALPRLRRVNAGFRTPGLIVPVLGTVVSLMFVLALDRWKLLAGALALAAGAAIFFITRPAGES